MSTESFPAPRRTRFSLLQLLYAVLLLGVGFGLGHLWGAVCAAGALTAWGYIFWIADEPRSALPWFLLLGAGLLAVGIVFEPYSQPTPVTQRNHCHYCLRHIGIALHAYHSDHGCFPPAYFSNSNGQPAHSWRVILLRYLEEPFLLKRYRFTEPWNGPNNKLLESDMPVLFGCPSQAHGFNTPYRLIVGPGSAFANGEAPRLADLPLQPIAIAIEDHLPQSSWMEPRDVTQQEALAMLNDPNARAPHHYKYYWHASPRGRHVLMSNGLVLFVEAGLDRTIAEELLGMRPNSPSHLESLSASTRPRYDNWFRAGLLLGIALLPVPWAFVPRESPYGDRASYDARAPV